MIACVRKSWLAQSSRRTRASASLKVGNGFGYQLAVRGGGVVRPYRSWAHNTINENSPSKAGVVRRSRVGPLTVALSPRWRRTSASRASVACGVVDPVVFCRRKRRIRVCDPLAKSLSPECSNVSLLRSSVEEAALTPRTRRSRLACAFAAIVLAAECLIATVVPQQAWAAGDDADLQTGAGSWCARIPPGYGHPPINFTPLILQLT